ncbi:heavy metal translocating P-type ATPase [Bacteroidales bacterium OttesenSCG-928-I21]|nr:heavy metal translocating P-type ATPase [Bacteroidales bacterium OttesenSCG-928-I21]
MKTQKFDITGMTCSACSSHIENSLKKLDGVKSVQVNLLTNNMQITYDDKTLDESIIENEVENQGYKAYLHQEKSTKKTTQKGNPIENEKKEMKKRLYVSFIFLIPLMYVSMGDMIGLPQPAFLKGNENAVIFSFLQFLLTLPIVLVNKKYFQVGFKQLFKGHPNMDSLVAIGASAALFYGIFSIFQIGYGLGHGDLQKVHTYYHSLYFESAAMILTLITLGKFLEAKSKGKTSDAISKLMNLTPKKAIVLRNNEEIEISVEDLVINDLIIIKPGQTIPVDGIITEGNSSVDESSITGESMPVFKEKNSPVISGTINKSGAFTFRATKVGNDTTLSQIIMLMEEASSSKAPISRLADKISNIFVPVVIVIAVIATIVWLLLGYPFDFALSIGISVLVISCPCALGLATPVAIMAGTGKAAENGIIIKSAEALEIAHTVDTIVLDKTGTITEGKPKITDIKVDDFITENDFLRLLASLEKRSEHPLAEAIVNEANIRNLSLLSISDFQSLAGQGIEAKISGKTYLAGNLNLMQERNIEINGFDKISVKFADEGKTSLFFADNEKVLGIVAVADSIKPTSPEAIELFKNMGMSVVMLTGDSEKTAQAIQQQVKTSRFVAEVLPQDKEKEISRLQQNGSKVAMIGDGINDAPALVKADVGIAIGAGTDIAIEAADIVLIKSDLTDAVNVIKLSKAVIRNIKQNLFWAFFYNILGIPLAAGLFYSLNGLKLNPMFAAAAMSLSSLFVVTNSLRLRNFKSIKSSKTENKNLMKQKTIFIEGMSCSHCSGRVEKALNSIDGVEATVNLEEKKAIATLSKDVSDEMLKQAVENAGYEVKEIN